MLDVAATDPEAVKLGAGLNKAYAAALRMGKGQYANVLERARAAAEDYLAHFPPQRRGAILLGALASVYGKDEGGADTVAWLARTKDKQGELQTSIAHKTVAALREIGLLDDIVPTRAGLVVYPVELDSGDGEISQPQEGPLETNKD